MVSSAISGLADAINVSAIIRSPCGHGLRGRDGKLIAAVIEFVLGVALDPVTADLMRIAQLQKLCPEVGVERRLFIGLFPPVAPPRHLPALAERNKDRL